jgi:pyruvate dehydrogenase E1 component alpha subunit
MQTAGTDRIAVAFTEAGAPATGWADALRWAHRDRLPFLLLVADNGTAGRSKRSARNAPPLFWPELTKLAHGIHLPHFPVDGEDAVAVYRVMQETSARARSGGGPSVIWAMLSGEQLARRQQPLTRLEDYMAVRGIKL